MAGPGNSSGGALPRAPSGQLTADRCCSAGSGCANMRSALLLVGAVLLLAQPAAAPLDVTTHGYPLTTITEPSTGRPRRATSGKYDTESDGEDWHVEPGQTLYGLLPATITNELPLLPTDSTDHLRQ